MTKKIERTPEQQAELEKQKLAKEQRNNEICKAYAEGTTLSQLSEKYGIAISQAHRILSKFSVKKQNEHKLDAKFFKENAGRSYSEISEITGVPATRVQYLARVAKYGSGSKLSRGRIDFRGEKPEVDPSLIGHPAWLKKQYETEGLGAPSIAKMLGVHVRDVYKAFKKYGIERRTVSQSMNLVFRDVRPSKEWLEEHYVKLGWNFEQCAARLGIDWKTVKAALIQYGLLGENHGY